MRPTSSKLLLIGNFEKWALGNKVMFHLGALNFNTSLYLTIRQKLM